MEEISQKSEDWLQLEDRLQEKTEPAEVVIYNDGSHIPSEEQIVEVHASMLQISHLTICGKASQLHSPSNYQIRPPGMAATTEEREQCLQQQEQALLYSQLSGQQLPVYRRVLIV